MGARLNEELHHCNQNSLPSFPDPTAVSSGDKHVGDEISCDNISSIYSEESNENDNSAWLQDSEEDNDRNYNSCRSGLNPFGDDDFQSAIKDSLVQWVAECNIPRCHVSNLLRRLNKDAKLSFLLLDARTLMLSKRDKVVLKDIPP